MPPNCSSRSVGVFVRFSFVSLLVSCGGLAFGQADADPAASESGSPIPSLAELVNTPIGIVKAAGKRPQPLSEAPASVTILTGEEAKLYGHRTLGDMLRSVRGLHVSYDRNYQFLGTRGFNRGDFNSRVLVLVDGHRVNNSLTDGAFIGTAFILDVDLIDRVEVVRGPGSVLYGNNAFFGVINVITRRGADLMKGGAFGVGGEVSTEWGRYRTTKTRVTLGHQFTNRLEGLEVLLSGSIYDSEGAGSLYYEEYDDPSAGNVINNGIAEGLDGDRYENLFGSLRYHDFSVQAAWIDRRKSIPTAPGVVLFNDPKAQTRDERFFTELKYERAVEVGGEPLTLMGRVYYDRSDYDRSAVLEDGYRFDEKQVGEWWGAEGQVTREFWGRATFTAGAEYRSDFRQDSRSRSENPAFVGAVNSRSRENYGVYAQGDVVLVEEKLRFTGGVRYDSYEGIDSSVNPRLALIYSPWEHSVFKAIAGTAFRAPNFRELADPRFGNIGSEEITSYELVYEQQMSKHLRSSVTAFYNEIADLIAFHSGTFTNLDADAVGLEIGLEGVWASGWRTRVSYSIQEVVDEERVLTDRVLTDAPKHLAKVSLIAPLVRDKVFLSTEFQFTSSRNTTRTTTSMGPETLRGEDAASFGVFNLTLYGRNLVPGLDVSASLYNVLNQGYDDPSTPSHLQDLIPQNGRVFNLQLSYRF